MTVFVHVDFDTDNKPSQPAAVRTKMPSKKKPSRATHAHAQPAVVSDYDTDTANYTDTQAAIPVIAPLSNRSSEELNLIVLRRWYPEVESILAIAPYASLYSYDGRLHQWGVGGPQGEVTGSLFVCQLSPSIHTGYPRYKVIILNRKHMTNFELDLVSTESIDLNEEYLMYTVFEEGDELPQIFGIWMLADKETGIEVRDHVVKTIFECAAHVARFTLAESEAYSTEDAYEEEEEREEQGDVEYDGDPSILVESQSQAYERQGQQIDLATLFGKPSDPLRPTRGVGFEQRPSRFIPSADTDFFRQYPPAPTPPPPSTATARPPPQAHQNALLHLFKNAQHG